MPFTYLIGWSKLDKWYIGSRWADGCMPSDLWDSYFTSSKYVHQFRNEHGEPDVIEIDKVFENKKDAISHEIFLLKINRVQERDCFLNKAIGGFFDPSDPEMRRKISQSNKGIKQSDQWIKKRTEWKRGVPHSKEHCQKISKALTGKKMTDLQRANISQRLIGNLRRKGTSTSDEGRANIAASKIGTRHTDETKKKMSDARKGKKFDQVKCPHCGKIGGKSAMHQWHFDHCKFKE